MSKTFPMTINGESLETVDATDVLNPATEQVVGRAPIGTVDHVDKAVAAARAAFPAWAAKSDEERQQACRDMAAAIEANFPELSQLVTEETGKTQSGMGAQFEVGGAIAWTQATAEMALPTEAIRQDETSDIELHYEPIGVCGSITPWNWPLLIAIWHVVPAIRMGNAVVIKPSPNTPLSTLRLGELLQDTLPPGVLNVVSGGNEVGAAISSHPDIDKLTFTGSTPTGKAIMRSSADSLKRLTLELGGNDAGIILPGSEIKPLIEGLFWGSFINSGQTCGALKRLYVHEDQYEEVCEALVAFSTNIPMGNGMDEANLLGPLQNKMQFDIVDRLVEDAKVQGCRILCGGEAPDAPGYFYPITLIADATDGMQVVDKEQFGPCLPIIRYTDLDEAIAAANGLEMGLCASVWGQDGELLASVAKRLQAGTVYINKHAELAPDTPFGGIKSSGIGVEFGIEGLKAYTNIKILNKAA